MSSSDRVFKYRAADSPSHPGKTTLALQPSPLRDTKADPHKPLTSCSGTTYPHGQSMGTASDILPTSDDIGEARRRARARIHLLGCILLNASIRKLYCR